MDHRVIGDPFVDHVEEIELLPFRPQLCRGIGGTRQWQLHHLGQACHDLDLLYWLFGARCQTIASNASLCTLLGG